MTRLCLILGCTLFVGTLHAQQPLHQRIDAMIAKSPALEKQPAPLADDAEFVRRVYLDLVGTIPTTAQARSFLNDSSPGKRAKVIDDLLASPEHARHLSQVLDLILMERRPTKANLLEPWREFLRQSVAANKPWDQLTKEILGADGADPKTRPAARFFVDRDGEPHALTRDVGRLFLGVDFQCAQCHDHPLIDDYKQDMYYGVFAFLNRTSVVTDSTLKLMVLSEKADGEVSYQSVFDPAKVTKTSLPRVLDRPALKEPPVEKGKEYVVKPEKTIRGVPKYSRRAQLGEELARADSTPFRENIANRLWAHLMGIGLVHPLEFRHTGNPPSHPELLKLLGDELAAHKFDLRWLLRELALSKTYQRSSAAATPVGPRTFLAMSLKPLSPEVLAVSLHEATGITEIQRQALGKTNTEAALYQRVSRNVAPLIQTFAGEAGKPQLFEPTLDHALFFSNSPVLRGWLTMQGENLLVRLSKLKDEQVAEEAYLSVLTRLPSAEDKQDVMNYLKAPNKNRTTALQEVVWALLTSAEFRFNH